MKKISFFITVLFSFFALSGCTNHVELDRIAIVEAVGVDYDGQEYTVSIQYFNMDQSGGTTLVDNSKPNIITVKGKGNTTGAAIVDASFRCGRSFMLGIAEIIVIGRAAAENDLSELLSFASSHYQSNSRVLVAVAEDKAEDVLGVKFKEGQTSVDKLGMILHNAQDLGYSYPPELFGLLGKLSQPTGSAVLPLLSVKKDNPDFSDDGKNVEITGGALITDGKLTDTLGIRESSGAQFLMNKADSSEITVKSGENVVTVVLYETKTEIIPVFADGKLEITVNISSDGKYAISNLSAPVETRGEIGKLCSEIIAERTRAVIEKALSGYGADFADIKYTITTSDYYSWLRIGENYREYLKNAEYEVNCMVDIERYGVSRQ